MTKTDPRPLGALAVALFCAAAVLVSYAVHGSMAYNPIALPAERTVETTSWVPEGWKFFTRNPQEEYLIPYALEGGTWRAVSSPSGSPRYAFGLDRSGRTQGMEMALFLGDLKGNKFHSCEEDGPETCLSRGTPLRIKNTSPSPTLCGPVGLVLQRPVPWAWASSGRTIVMPSRVLRLDVAC